MTDSGDLPDESLLLLLDQVGDLDRLQMLLTLVGAPDRAWTAADLAEAATVPLETATEAVEGLVSCGFIQQVGSTAGLAEYRYVSSATEKAASIESLASDYRRNPVPIIKLLTAHAIRRVKTAAIRTFADAFVLGKKKDG